MATRSYFESITSRSTLEKHKHKHPPLYRNHTLPAASDWGTEELFASRVVVSPRHHRILPYQALSSEAFQLSPRLPSGAELSKIITPLPPGSEALTETELVHQLGGMAGMFWAALRRFTDPQPPSPIYGAEMRDLDSADDVGGGHPPSSPVLPQTQRARRRRAQQQYPDYVDSSRIKIASSSPIAGSQLSSSTTSDYISREEHGRRALAEDATVELASAFLRHSLFQCPLQQHVTTAYPEDVLLEFSGIRRRMVATLRSGTLAFEATADGEVALLRRNNGAGRFISRGEVIGLLEAKKRLTVIREGRPVMTDQVLGQMVGEALALRLSLSAVEASQGRDTILIFLAAQQYLRFLSFTIPDAYVERLLFHSSFQDDVADHRDDDDGGAGDVMNEDEDDEKEEGGGEEEEQEAGDEVDIITVRATDWLDLGSERGRQLACDNITALVNWQLNSP